MTNDSDVAALKPEASTLMDAMPQPAPNSLHDRSKQNQLTMAVPVVMEGHMHLQQ